MSVWTKIESAVQRRITTNNRTINFFEQSRPRPNKHSPRQSNQPLTHWQFRQSIGYLFSDRPSNLSFFTSPRKFDFHIGLLSPSNDIDSRKPSVLDGNVIQPKPESFCCVEPVGLLMASWSTSCNVFCRHVRAGLILSSNKRRVLSCCDWELMQLAN